MMGDFTHDGYRDLLGALADRGYVVRGYDDADPEARHLILRHDLDMSLEAAEPIAEIEREAGVVAWYFVLLRTEMYNLFAPQAARQLSRLRALGHEIGLHLDASIYGDDLALLEDAVQRECQILEVAVEAPVRAISFHRPARTLIGLDRNFANRPHAYQSRFITDMGYCSDSRGAWHHGRPLDHPTITKARALQLLTHPIWWSSGKAVPVQDRLDSFARERCGLLRRELGRNCTAYDAGVAGSLDGDTD